MNNYYKIEDAETLAKIDAFFDKRKALYEAIHKMCTHFGFERHCTHDSIKFGIKFYNMVANSKKDVIDKKLWKTSKSRGGDQYLNVLPRATAKEHKALYGSMLPKSMEYAELNNLILSSGVDIWSKSYGYRYKKGEYFMFETSLPVSSLAIEILGSEFMKKDEEEL